MNNNEGLPSAEDLDANTSELRIREATSGPVELNGAELIMRERLRQYSEEDWSEDHDDFHTDAELADFAIAYVLEAVRMIQGDAHTKFFEGIITAFIADGWHEWFKPTADPIRNLVKAGALLAAEIDRLQRLKKQKDEMITRES